MKIIILGPAQSGKSTLLSTMILDNPSIIFSLIIDDYKGYSNSNNTNRINAFPTTGQNCIITTCSLQHLSSHILQNALILDVVKIRGLNIPQPQPKPQPKSKSQPTSQPKPNLKLLEKYLK
jgi:hypothetical protein